MIDAFSFASTPHFHFGNGSRKYLSGILESYGSSVLLVTGDRSFDQSRLCQQVWQELQRGFEIYRLKVTGEPSPQLVDAAVMDHRKYSPDCVLAIGGGSAIDAAKAIAGLLPSGDSVMDYLEGIGAGKIYQGPSTPFVAMPTTAGTGGETSKNAVLSEVGENGFKKSFRHESLVPEHIILDPEMTATCPPEITAACGMDAFTQLLESYVSCKANPMTDALSLSGLQCIKRSLLQAVAHGDDLDARSDMLYASSISGLTLANAGLGSVHGLASPLGAFFPIPHGMACGTMLYEAVKTNIHAMDEREPENVALRRYADVGRLMVDNTLPDHQARAALLTLLGEWVKRLAMPQLSGYGVGEDDIPRIITNISGGSMSGNPVVLQYNEIEELIRSRL